MSNPSEKQSGKAVITLADHTCPACGRSDRWEGIETREDADHNPELLVWCDCGQGELRIIVE